MAELPSKYDPLDLKMTDWMARNGVRLLRYSLGVVFLWFGILKFFPGLSPAQSLAGDTIARLSFDLLSPAAAVFLLAVWESLIGIGLLTGYRLRGTRRPLPMRGAAWRGEELHASSGPGG